MMRKLILFAALCGLVGCRQATPRVEIETNLGTITADIYSEQAPITAGNFLKLVDEGRYNEGANFYRATRADNQPNNPIKIDIIQGGLRGAGKGELTPIAHETTEQTGLRHLDGVLSMARTTPGTGTSEFFICIGDQPELDFGGRRGDGNGYAIFGKVVKGMEIVREIQAQPDSVQYLKEPVSIIAVRRIR